MKMKIQTNSIITLSNNEKYMVLNEATYEDNHYYLVMGVDANQEIISSKVAIFKEEDENNEIYVSKVSDSKLIIELTKLLKSQL